MGLLTLNLPVIGQSSATEDQKIRDALAALQTGVNGNLDEANVPNLTAAFTSWKALTPRHAAQFTSATSGTFVCPPVGATYGAPVASGAANSDMAEFFIDPADFTANTRTTQIRMRVRCKVGGTAPGVTFTCAIVAVTPGGSGAGLGPSIVGGAAQGTSVVFTTPAANTSVRQDQTAFTMPAAGTYAFQVTTSAAPAASSFTNLEFTLEYRQV